MIFSSPGGPIAAALIENGKKVLVEYVTEGDYTVEQAKEISADILFYNSNRLYSLGQSPEKDATTPVSQSENAASDSMALDAFIKANPEVKYIWMQWLDYTSTPRARMFPLHEFAKIAAQKRHLSLTSVTFVLLQDDRMASPTAFRAGHFLMRPDMSSLYANAGALPSKFQQPKNATVMAYGYRAEGTPYELCPRSTLRNIVDKFQAEHGISLLCGFEVEFVILKRSLFDENPLTKVHSWSQNSAEIRSKAIPILEEIVECLAQIGIDVEQFHPESAPAQFELVLPPSSPVRAVDMLVMTRQVITDVVDRHSCLATFHPRPFSSAAGSASHSHISISPIGHEKSFLAGMLDHLPSILAFTLPQDSSYDRVKPGLFAGGVWVAWGTQNKETPIRKITSGRWEVKTVDGLSNTYLGIAALLAAGHLGIKKRQPLTLNDCQGKVKYYRKVYYTDHEANHCSMIVDPASLTPEQRREAGITTRLPKNITESLAALQSDRELQAVLGKELVQGYAAVKRTEKEMLDCMSSDDRRKWLLERY